MSAKKSKNIMGASIKNKMMLLIGVSITIILSVMIAVIVPTVISQHKRLAYDQLREMANGFANEINVQLAEFRKLSHTLTYTMEEYDYSNPDRTEVNNILNNLLEHNPGVIGIYVGYEPNAFDGNDSSFIGSQGHDETGRFVPYWNRFSGSITLDPLLGMDTDDWYQIPYNTHEFKVFEPFLYEGVLMISFINPLRIKGNDSQTVGVAGCDISLNYLDKYADKISVFKSGYGMILSKTGIFMSHPTNKDWIGNKTIADVELGGEMNTEIVNNITDGNQREYQIKDEVTGKVSIVFSSPIDIGNFSFLMVAPIDEMLAGVFRLRNMIILLSMVFIVLGLVFALMLARNFSKPIIKALEYTKDISNGDLTHRLEVDSKDEVGMLVDGT